MAGFCLFSPVSAMINLVNISSATATNNSINNATFLIKDANGDADYDAPNPNGGGISTSWYGVADFIALTFNFSQAEDINALYLWDYFSFSPTDWRLNLYSDLDAGGTNLLVDHDFSIVIGPAPIHSGRHVIDLPDTIGTRSALLINTNLSQSSGVGLSEVAFSQVPEPSAYAATFGIAVILIALMRRKVIFNRNGA